MMASKIKVDSRVMPYFMRAAAELGIEISAEPGEAPLFNDDFLTIVAISSSQTQIASYPAIRVSRYRNRFLISPFQGGDEFLRKLQTLVNERVRREGLEGVVTFIFSIEGELLQMREQISLDSLWSIEFSITSVFDNAIRAAKGLPLGKTHSISQDWAVINFDAPSKLEMTQPFRHLFAHEPGYRINKATSHSGYIALQDTSNLIEKVCHAVDYLEGVITE